MKSIKGNLMVWRLLDPPTSTLTISDLLDSNTNWLNRRLWEPLIQFLITATCMNSRANSIDEKEGRIGRHEGIKFKSLHP